MIEILNKLSMTQLVKLMDVNKLLSKVAVKAKVSKKSRRKKSKSGSSSSSSSSSSVEYVENAMVRQKYQTALVDHIVSLGAKHFLSEMDRSDMRMTLREIAAKYSPMTGEALETEEDVKSVQKRVGNVDKLLKTQLRPLVREYFRLLGFEGVMKELSIETLRTYREVLEFAENEAENNERESLMDAVLEEIFLHGAKAVFVKTKKQFLRDCAKRFGCAIKDGISKYLVIDLILSQEFSTLATESLKTTFTPIAKEVAAPDSDTDGGDENHHDDHDDDDDGSDSDSSEAEYIDRSHKTASAAAAAADGQQADSDQELTPSKRTRSKSGSIRSPPTQRSKPVEKTPVHVDRAKSRDADRPIIRNGITMEELLTYYLNEELRNFCRYNDLSYNGSKKDYATRILNFFDEGKEPTWIPPQVRGSQQKRPRDDGTHGLSSDEDETMIVSTPPPRKRGRPPKKKRSTPAKASAQSDVIVERRPVVLPTPKQAPKKSITMAGSTPTSRSSLSPSAQATSPYPLDDEFSSDENEVELEFIVDDSENEDEDVLTTKNAAATTTTAPLQSGTSPTTTTTTTHKSVADSDDDDDEGDGDIIVDLDEDE